MYLVQGGEGLEGAGTPGAVAAGALAVELGGKNPMLTHFCPPLRFRN